MILKLANRRANINVGAGRITIVGRQLLLYLPQAQQPRIWRLPLKLSQPMEFTLRPLDAVGQQGWCLLYLNPHEPQQGFELARFANEQDGRDVLAAMAETLWHAPDLHKMLQHLPVPKSALPMVLPVRQGKMPGWLKFILILLVIFILASSVLGAIGRVIGGAIATRALQSEDTAITTSPVPNGVPVDANEILGTPNE